jgi:hypothetical protein
MMVVYPEYSKLAAFSKPVDAVNKALCLVRMPVSSICLQQKISRVPLTLDVFFGKLMFLPDYRNKQHDLVQKLV